MTAKDFPRTPATADDAAGEKPRSLGSTFRNISSFLAAPWKLLFQNRRILTSLYRSDLRGRFAAGNVFGWAWLVLYPLMFVSCYALVFIGLLANRTDGSTPAEQILRIFVGFVPWWGISETIATGAALVHANASLLKNNIFPLELLATRSTFVSMTQMLITLVVVFVGSVFFVGISITLVQVPLLIVMVTVGCIGLSWFLATIGAFFRDLSYAISIFIMVMMIISPVGYTEEQAGGALKKVLAYNPVTYVIRAFRDAISNQQWVDPGLLLALGMGSLIVFYLGYFVFSRLKLMFADLV